MELTELREYRAWDRNEEQMYQVAQLWFDPKSHPWGAGILDEHNDFHSIEEITLMRFTGLLDASKNKIFVGDIVENYAMKGVVIIVKGVVTTHMSAKDKFGVPQPLAVHTGLKVIGDRFRNPELV